MVQKEKRKKKNTKYENEIHVKNNTLLSFLNIGIITNIFMMHVGINQSSKNIAERTQACVL